MSLLSLHSNPFVLVSANGSTPIKIFADETGEIWKMPNGEQIAKMGGEPTMVQDGIVIEGTTVKSSKINVNLESLNGSEIVYENGNSTIAKENWFIYKDNVKIEWDNFSEKNLLMTNIPVTEKVGSFTVTDYAMQAVKEKTMNNVFGSLWIEYKIFEGRPLKHTLNFTSTSDGNYKLCQEFTDFNFDEIRKYDYDSHTDQIINATTDTNEKFDSVSLDSISKSDVYDQKIKKDPSLLLPEVIEFKKDGKSILGEITSGAKSDFESFEYDKTTKSAMFCYGDFIMIAGESFVIDPDTYSTNNPTQDGVVYAAATSGTSCGTVADSIATAGGTIPVFIPDADISDKCSRIFVEWPTSAIVDGAVISQVDFIFDVDFTSAPLNCDYMPMQFQPSIQEKNSLWKDIGNGTAYVANNTVCKTAGNSISVTLGSSANTDLQNLLTSDYFSVGVKFNSETRDSTNAHDVDFLPEEGTTPTPKPTLQVTYTAETDVLVTVNHFTGNSTALTSCNVTLTNSSSSETKACDSSGLAGLFTGRLGNHNATVIDSNNMVVNKTRNFTPASNLIINATIVEVNCVQTGSATDIRLWLNETDGHRITNMTRPVCTTSNQQPIVVSWNATFSPDGKNSATYNSDLRVEIRNVTAFGKNALKFFHNNVLNTTAYSSGVITSSDFPIGSGTASGSTLRKFYLWLDSKPDVPTSVSGSGASTSQIDLSWTAGNSGVSSITGYAIYRGTDGINFPTLVSANTGSAATLYSDLGLLVGTTYYYKIAAINSYGTGNNSTAGSVATQSANQGNSGSSGGSSSGTITTNNLQQLSITLVPKTGTLFLGETKTFDLDFTYDIAKSPTLKIQSLVLNTGNYDSLSIVPEQIPLEGKIVKDGKGDIKVTVHASENDCAKSTSATCVNLKPYVIQMSMLVQDANGGNQGSYPITLEVTIIDQPKSGTIIILLVMGLVIGGGAYGAYNQSSKRKPKSPSPKKHRRDYSKALKKASTSGSPKKHEHDYLKALKNAQKPVKKSFIGKLFK